MYKKNNEAKYLNYDFTNQELTFDEVRQELFDYWKNIAINIFEYGGLDEVSKYLTSEIIEDYLFSKGKAIFFNDRLRGYLCLDAQPNGKQNVYWKPIEFNAIGKGYQKLVSLNDGVLIKNNSLMKPTANLIWYYCGKLADIELTKDLNRDAIKMPYVFNTDEKTVLSAKNIFKAIHSHEPAIFKQKGRSETEAAIEVLNTGAQFYGAELDDEYNNYVAKILTLLGLDNYVEDKKERVQSAEVKSQDEYIIASFRASLESRQKAIDAINKKYGLKLTVDYVQGEQVETDEPAKEEEEDG